MQSVNECFNIVCGDCLKFIKSQESKTEKFKNKNRMIKSFLIPVCFWIFKKASKKKTTYFGPIRRSRNRQNNNIFDNYINIKKIF